MIAKVQSGGQTGTDVAGVRAARRLGIPTGGVMPKGWKTLDGPRPEYATMVSKRGSPVLQDEEERVPTLLTEHLYALTYVQ
jgi:hypothetical protein